MKIMLLFIIALCFSCTNTNNNMVEYNSYTKNIVYPEITSLNCPIEAKNFYLHFIDNYLVLENPYATDNLFAILNKSNFELISTGGKMGPGQGEISRPGPIVLSADRKSFWGYDYGKLKLWQFPIDSITNNSNFLPTTEISAPEEGVFVYAGFQNDTAIIGSFMVQHCEIATYNVQNHSFTTKQSAYPSLEKSANPMCSASAFALSTENEKYVRAYMYSDLLAVCNFDGSVHKLIIGPEGIDEKNAKTSTFLGVQFYKNYIFASYKGGNEMVLNSKKRREWSMPSNIIVFDLDGNYIKTYDVKEEFCSFGVDTENKRVVLYFPNAEKELGYFEINF